MRGLFINIGISLGVLGSVGLLATSKHWWQAIIASGLCAHFLILKLRVFTGAWRSM